MIRITRVPSIHNRDNNNCCVIKHPDPESYADFLAVYNMKTGEFKLNEKGKVKRYGGKYLSLAGQAASEDSSGFREVSETKPLLSYGPYEEQHTCIVGKVEPTRRGRLTDRELTNQAGLL